MTAGIVGNGMEFSQIDLSVGENPLLGADVDDFSQQQAGFLIVAQEFTFQSHGQLIDQRCIHKSRFGGVPAGLFQLVGLCISGNDPYIIRRNHIFRICHGHGEGLPGKNVVGGPVFSQTNADDFRIGYAAGPKDVIKAMTNYQSQATSNASTPAQHAAAVALTMPQDCVEDMRRSFQKRRDMMVSMLNSTPGLGCNMPHGAFYVMMNITELFGKYYGEKQINTSEDFALTLLENAHVATVPGSAFMAEGFCRLSYATSMENIEKGMDRIESFVKELS